MEHYTRVNWRSEWPRNWRIEPQTVYLVKIDGHTKFQSTSYRDAFEYVIAARADFRRRGIHDGGHVQMTVQS